MYFWQDPQFGDRMIVLMAALVLVLQITMVAQRWLVTNIHAFAIQSLLLAGIANTIAYFNSAPHIYIAAGLTVLFKAILLPVILRRLVTRIGIRQEIEPYVNVPVSVIVSGLLTLLAYVVAEPLQGRPEAGTASLGRNTLPVAIALFLIGFFMMINRRKALTQVLALLSLENGLFLAAISLTYGMPMIVELGIFFDVLVAVLILAILVYRISETFDSMDVGRLSRLKG
jgi:hydrogenase-4 component E